MGVFLSVYKLTSKSTYFTIGKSASGISNLICNIYMLSYQPDKDEVYTWKKTSNMEQKNNLLFYCDFIVIILYMLNQINVVITWGIKKCIYF